MPHHQAVPRVSLWGGRFAGGPADALAALSQHPLRLAARPATTSPAPGARPRAHPRRPAHAPSWTRCSPRCERLDADVDSGAFAPEADDEDVHTALERGLIDRAGADLGGRLRAGRSRNDQVATLFRMYLRDAARLVAGLVLDVVDALVDQATATWASPMPGRTHLQHAQPVLLSTICWPTPGRCCATSIGCATGTCAHRRLALRLGGARRLLARARPGGGRRRPGLLPPGENSIDGTASRDFVAEFPSCGHDGGRPVPARRGGGALGDQEFSFVTLDDAYSTGSSIMPQKKNPDVAELARGKAGRLVGDLAGLLTTLKGLPLAYNRDLQEDKEPVFDAVDTLAVLLPAFAGMVPPWCSTPTGWSRSPPQGFSLATDVAEWLVRAGCPFRVAHEVAGACVRRCEARGIELWDLSDADLGGDQPTPHPGGARGASVEGSLASRNAGGTAPARVGEQVASARDALAAARLFARTGPG